MRTIRGHKKRERKCFGFGGVRAPSQGEGVCIPPPSPVQQEWKQEQRKQKEQGDEGRPDQATAHSNKDKACRHTPI